MTQQTLDHPARLAAEALPFPLIVFDDLKRVLHLLWHGEVRPDDHAPEGHYAGELDAEPA